MMALLSGVSLDCLNDSPFAERFYGCRGIIAVLLGGCNVVARPSLIALEVR